MKRIYFFLLFLITLNLNAQNECFDAQSDLNYAYSHVKSAYDTNNLSHLKYYAKRSYDAFVRANQILKNCDCKKAYDIAFEAQQLLSKVPNTTKNEDGRFYVKRAKEIAKNAYTAFESCTNPTEEGYTLSTFGEEHALSSLEQEQQKLLEQQEKLKQRQAELKRQMLEKQQQEELLKKEKLITENELALNKNIDAYNNMLKSCNCNSPKLSKPNQKEDLSNKSLKEIKVYYINSVKRLTTDYLEQLNQCKI